MDRITPRVEQALDTTDPAITGPTIEWAHSIDPDDPRAARHGVVVAEDGQIIAHTYLVGSEPSAWHIAAEDARTLGLGRTVLDMNWGALRSAAGQEVRHVTYSNAARDIISRRRATTDAERALVQAHLALRRIEQQRADAIGARRAALAAYREQPGATMVAAAQLMGVSREQAYKIPKA